MSKQLNDDNHIELKTWLTPISKGELLHWLSEFGLETKVEVHKILEYIRNGDLEMTKEDCNKYFDEYYKR